MSCMMLTDNHFATIAGICSPMRGRASDDEIISIMGILKAQNQRAYDARYPGEAVDDDDAELPACDVSPAKAFDLARRASPVELLKTCQCYAYQACDDEKGWPTSKARELIERAMANVTAAMPGYDDAPWGVPH